MVVVGHRHTPAALSPWKRPGTHCIGGSVGPRVGLDRCGKFRPYRDSISGPSSPLRVAILTGLSRSHLGFSNLFFWPHLCVSFIEEREFSDQATRWTSTGDSVPLQSGRDVVLTTHPHCVPRLRMSGAIHPFSLSCMTWSLHIRTQLHLRRLV